MLRYHNNRRLRVLRLLTQTEKDRAHLVGNGPVYHAIVIRGSAVMGTSGRCHFGAATWQRLPRPHGAPLLTRSLVSGAARTTPSRQRASASHTADHTAPHRRAVGVSPTTSGTPH